MVEFKYYHTGEPNLKHRIGWKLKKLRKFLTENTKILDVGCSTGGLYFSIKDIIKKENYYGIDYNKYAVEMAENKGLNVKQCDIRKEEIPFKEKFDIVWMNHVIEHFTVEEQIKVINKLRNILKPNGLIFIFAPTPYHWYFWDDFTHVRPCTHGQLSDLLRNNGFIILESKYSRIRYFPQSLQKFLRLPPIRWFLWEVYCIGKKLE